METTNFKFVETKQGASLYDRYLAARHQVFCEALQRVAPTGQIDGNGQAIETDLYDQRSRHFVALDKQTDEIAAFVRVILPSDIGLSAPTRYVIEDPLPYPDAAIDRIGEISRMAIMARYRRRRSDQGWPVAAGEAGGIPCPPSVSREHQQELVLGMYREIYQLCREVGVGYCLAALDRSFSRILVMFGFPFVPVGPVNEDVVPPRRVFIISSREIERSLGTYKVDALQFMQELKEELEDPA